MSTDPATTATPPTTPPAPAAPGTAPASPPTDPAAPVVDPAVATATAQKAAGVVPPTTPTDPPKAIEYDLKLSEHSPLTDSDTERILAEAKAEGLSKEAAQALIAREEKAIDDYEDKRNEHVEKIRAGWLGEVEADPEIGGANFKESVELSQRVLKNFGSEKLLKVLEETGFGNHPEIVRVFSTIGKNIADDKFVKGNSQLPAPQSTKDVLYGETSPD